MKIKSTLTKFQVKEFKKEIKWEGKGAIITAKVRYDDKCGNGHNTFSITGNVWIEGKKDPETCGCIHDLIARHFPRLRHLIKWHLVSSDGPLYYIDNTMYHAKEHGVTHAWIRADYVNEMGIHVNELEYLPIKAAQRIKKLNPNKYTINEDISTIKIADLEAARSCAIWPDATLEQLRDKGALLARLPKLMEEFRKDIKDLGFVF